MPIYWLFVFKLPAKIRKKIDRIRRKILCSVNSASIKKYNKVSWIIVCHTKEQGGLGVKNLDLVNKAY